MLHHALCNVSSLNQDRRSGQAIRELSSLQIMWKRRFLQLKFLSMSVLPSLAGTRIMRRLFNIDHSARNVGYIAVVGTNRSTPSHVQTRIPFIKDSCSLGTFPDLNWRRKLLVTDPASLTQLFSAYDILKLKLKFMTQLNLLLQTWLICLSVCLSVCPSSGQMWFVVFCRM
jgi:hypothetical protein